MTVVSGQSWGRVEIIKKLHIQSLWGKIQFVPSINKQPVQASSSYIFRLALYCPKNKSLLWEKQKTQAKSMLNCLVFFSTWAEDINTSDDWLITLSAVNRTNDLPGRKVAPFRENAWELKTVDPSREKNHIYRMLALLQFSLHLRSHCEISNSLLRSGPESLGVWVFLSVLQQHLTYTNLKERLRS